VPMPPSNVLFGFRYNFKWALKDIL
jgi:hypothetical protein